jgi:MerR family copper efflux transcriptional regulator
VNIGAASAASGVSAKMIRYYERIGLVPAAARSGSAYRVYGASDVRRLRFVHRAREFGFPIARIRALIGLWQEGRPSREVKQVALAQLAELDAQIGRLRAMADTLRDLADACQGDHRPDCPILADMERDDRIS